MAALLPPPAAAAHVAPPVLAGSANGAADRWIALPRLPIAYRYRFLAHRAPWPLPAPRPSPVEQQAGHRLIAADMSQVDTLKEISTSFQAAYRSTPTKLKLLDAFSVCALLTAVLQVGGVAMRRPPGRSSAGAPPLAAARRRTAVCRCCRILARLAAATHASPQFAYAKLVGTFPFNAFLAGFFCCIGAFVVSAAHGRTLLWSSGPEGHACWLPRPLLHFLLLLLLHPPTCCQPHSTPVSVAPAAAHGQPAHEGQRGRQLERAAGIRRLCAGDAHAVHCGLELRGLRGSRTVPGGAWQASRPGRHPAGTACDPAAASIACALSRSLLLSRFVAPFCRSMLTPTNL